MYIDFSVLHILSVLDTNLPEAYTLKIQGIHLLDTNLPESYTLKNENVEKTHIFEFSQPLSTVVD